MAKIYIKDGVRFNIYIPRTINGESFGFSAFERQDIRDRFGVLEIDEPTPPSDYDPDFYIRTEQDDAPYVVYTKKSDEQLAQVRWNKLKQIRDDLTDNGGCLVQGKWFHTDPKSKQQQMALTMVGANLPNNLMWKTMDGTFVLMTPELVMELFSAQVAREQTIFVTAETKKSDQTDVNEGWPVRYVAEVVDVLG